VSAPHLSAGGDVPGQFDFGEVALADCFEEPVVADMRLLRLIGAAGSHASPARARAELRAAVTVRRMLQREHVVRRVESFLLRNIYLDQL